MKPNRILIAAIVLAASTFHSTAQVAESIWSKTALGAAPATDDKLYLYDTSATASKTMTIANLFTGPAISSLALTGTTTTSGALTQTSASATAFESGPNGGTNPVFRLVNNVSSAATGLSITGRAAAAGVDLTVLSSGTNENLVINAKGSGTISLNPTGTGNIVLGRAATGVSFAATGLVTSSSSSDGIGYATGAGGAVTQATNRTTGVTLSKISGQITTSTGSLAAGAAAEFTVTNTTVAATDVIAVNITPGGTGRPWAYVSNVSAGSFKITVENHHASTADTSADVINFAVIKAVAN